jgi:hypothetical protein
VKVDNPVETVVDFCCHFANLCNTDSNDIIPTKNQQISCEVGLQAILY